MFQTTHQVWNMACFDDSSFCFQACTICISTGKWCKVMIDDRSLDFGLPYSGANHWTQSMHWWLYHRTLVCFNWSCPLASNQGADILCMSLNAWRMIRELVRETKSGYIRLYYLLCSFGSISLPLEKGLPMDPTWPDQNHTKANSHFDSLDL